MRSHPLSRRFTVVSLVLAAVGLGGWPARPAAAADDWTVQAAANQFGAGRERFGHTVNPGGDVEDGIVVVNRGAAPLHVTVRAAEGFDLRSPSGSGLGAWVRPDRDDVTVAPGASTEVPFAVAPPRDAAPGDYAGGIVASDGERSVGVPIRLRVGGALKPSLAVESVQVDYADSPNPFGKGDATVTYTIHNTGNAILTARQSVSLSGPFGRWKVNAARIADAPPLLPGDRRTVSVPLHDVTPALRLGATVTLTPLLTDAAGSTAPLAAVKSSGHTVTAPWALLLVVVVLGGVAVAAVALLSRAGRVRDRRGTSSATA